MSSDVESPRKKNEGSPRKQNAIPRIKQNEESPKKQKEASPRKHNEASQRKQNEEAFPTEQNDLSPRKHNEISSRKQSDISSLKGAEPKRKPKGGNKRSKSPATTYPFFTEDEFSDVAIKTAGDRKLFSNRCLLSYNSPVFMKKLSDETGGGGKGKAKTASNKELDLSDKKYEDVCEMLAFIDPRVDYKLKDSDAIQLLPLANEFDLHQLKKSCEWTVTESFFRMRKGRRAGCVPTDISIQHLVLSDKYDFKDLKEMCMEELVANDSPFSCKLITDNDDLSEHVKRQVLERKLDKVNLALAKERRLKTETNQAKDTRGSTIWKK